MTVVSKVVESRLSIGREYAGATLAHRRSGLSAHDPPGAVAVQSPQRPGRSALRSAREYESVE
jgi:hypothetical protein